MQSLSFASLSIFLAGCSGGAAVDAADAGPPPANAVPPGSYRVLAANDLGMHCMDRDFSTYSILPPFNVLRAQILQRNGPGGTPRLLQPNEVDVTYEAVVDAHGSINSTSVNKTQFWTYAPGLFGVTLPIGMGLTGLYMPADAPTPGPQPLSWVPNEEVFHAFGIPITPIDDNGVTNPYPMLRVRAKNPATGATLATLDVVVPVSGETDCRNCHLTGQVAALDPAITWSTDPSTDLQANRNVLILHDAREGTDLVHEQPVLCAKCHNSPPLDIGSSSGTTPQGTPSTSITATPSGPHTNARGQLEHDPAQMSRVMHEFHGRQTDALGNLLFPPNGDALSTCYQCHPGAITECLRGAMKDGGMECLSCHGDMLAVGGAFPLEPGGSLDGQNDLRSRRPWADLPRCQSCHTGDALNHLSGPGLVVAPDGIRLRQAYRTGDPAASPIASPASRFAENPNTLYRFSKGHGNVSCENCHGSTHAEWPNADPGANDNVTPTQLQGHTGTIIECATCHAGNLPRTMNGPHGMHNVDQLSFIDGGHHDFYAQNPASCQACHGANLLGTALSRAAADRSWSHDGHTWTVSKGTPIACNLCHSLPGSGGDDD